MKKRFKDEDRVGIFGRIKRVINDFFYSLSVKMAEFSKKHFPSKKTKSIKSRTTKRLWFYIAIVALPVLHYFIFYVCVNFNSILLSFQQYEYPEGGGRITKLVWFENYGMIIRELFAGGKVFTLVSNSLLYYFIGLLMGTTLSLLFSYYIYKKYYFSEFFRIVLFIPSMVSTLVMVMMYKHAVDYGAEAILKALGKQVVMPMGEVKYQKIFIIAYSLIMCFGVNVIMYSSSMTRIPVSVVEYAAIDGVGALREFITITLPLIFGTLSTFLITGFTSIFTNQQNLFDMFGGLADMSLQTVGYYTFKITYESRTTENTYPEAAAFGLFFTLFSIPITFILRWALGKLDPNVQY